MGPANTAHDAGPRARGSRTKKATASSSSGENCFTVRCVTTKCMLTLMLQPMSITPFIANGTGRRATSRRHLPLSWRLGPEAPLHSALCGYRSWGRSLGRAIPLIQARPVCKRAYTNKVVGLALVHRGHVPAYLPLRTASAPIASQDGWKERREG